MKKQSSKEPQWTGFPSSESEAKEIKSAIMSTYEYYVQIAEAKEQLKDIYSEIHAKYGIPKRLFNFLAKDNYEGNGREQVQKNSELEDALNSYESIEL